MYPENNNVVKSAIKDVVFSENKDALKRIELIRTTSDLGEGYVIGIQKLFKVFPFDVYNQQINTTYSSRLRRERG